LNVSRILGLDWGSRRIGVAITDDRNSFAVGYGVWSSADAEFFARLEQAVRTEGVDLIVVGYPLTLRGEIGPKAREVDGFIEKLEQRGYRTQRWDERFTTHDASRTLARLGVSQKKQRGKLDISAAVIMLQSYLDESSTAQKTTLTD
jgi:putative Holliday junction resolvase